MKEWIIQLVNGFPPEIATFLLALLPVTELRASLPIALTVFDLPIWSAFLLSVLGSSMAIPIVYAVLPPVVRWARAHSPRLGYIIDRYFSHLEHTHRGAVERWGAFGLVLFVAIPIPGTGAWSATVLAILFAIRPGYAVPAIVAGLIASCIIVLLITQGTLGVLSFLV